MSKKIAGTYYVEAGGMHMHVSPTDEPGEHDHQTVIRIAVDLELTRAYRDRRAGEEPPLLQTSTVSTQIPGVGELSLVVTPVTEQLEPSVQIHASLIPLMRLKQLLQERKLLHKLNKEFCVPIAEAGGHVEKFVEGCLGAVHAATHTYEKVTLSTIGWLGSHSVTIGSLPAKVMELLDKVSTTEVRLFVGDGPPTQAELRFLVDVREKPGNSDYTNPVTMVTVSSSTSSLLHMLRRDELIKYLENLDEKFTVTVQD